jgi:hypothetical protein
MSVVMSRSSRGWALASIALLLAGAAVWAQQQDGDNAAPVPAEASKPAAVRLWDTGTPLEGQIDVAWRDGWRAITPGARSHLQGDLVVETNTLATVFASQLGKVLVYAEADPSRSRAELLPVELRGRRATIGSTTIIQHPAGALTVKAGFSAPGASSIPLVFSFTSDRVLAITPEGAARGVSVAAPIDLAVVPSFVGDDLIYDPRDYPSAKALSVPSEHFLLGLLKGGNSALVMTWQEDKPPVSLVLSNPGPGRASIQAADFTGAGTLSLAVLDAPGIWCRQALKPSFLERDVAIGWKPPFPAVWLTQLYEDEVKTTFEFRDAKEEVWRGAVGSYNYPAWFSGGKTMLSLGKSIVPEGEAVIYFLERSDRTPEQALSPVDIVKATLTGDVLASILDVEGRPSWYPERPNRVLGGATCGVTDQLKEIFDRGQEVEKQAIVKGGVEDMYFYLEGMFRLDARYYPFATDMVAYLDAQEKQMPELAPFIREMRGIANEIVTTYDNSRDTIRDMSFAHELGEKTIALAAEKRPDNAQRMVELKQDWTGMGGALEELARKEHTLTRKLHQQAAYRAAAVPEAMPLAEEIRRRARQCLEKPGSYEIWADD